MGNSVWIVADREQHSQTGQSLIDNLSAWHSLLSSNLCFPNLYALYFSFFGDEMCEEFQLCDKPLLTVWLHVDHILTYAKSI